MIPHELDPDGELWTSTLAITEKLNRTFAERGGNRDFPRAAWDVAGQGGLLGLSIPSAFGGTGLGASLTARVCEAFGYGCEDGGLVFSAGAHLFACAMPLAESGNESVMRRMLPKLATGEWVGANAISEPEAGSDLAAIRTRATPEAGGFRLDGSKTFVTNAPSADVFLVYASTSPSHGYMGISAFAVERSRPGITVGEPFRKMGLASAQTAPVYFENCWVPADNLLGEAGQGLGIFNRSMSWERTCMFAAFLGAQQRLFAKTLEYARERKQFRRAIAKYAPVGERLARIQLTLERARLLLYSACSALDQGKTAAAEVAMAKLAVSEASLACSLDSIRVHGGIGVMMESNIPQGLLDAVPALIFSGTSDLQRETIARELRL